MASCSSDEKCTLTECFEQHAVIEFYANCGMTPTETWNFCSSNDSVKKYCRTIMLTGTSDSGIVGWISVMTYSLGDPIFPTELRAFKTRFKRASDVQLNI